MTTSVDQNSSGFRAAFLAALLARHYPLAGSHAIGLVVADIQASTRRAKAFSEAWCSYDLGDVDDPKSRAGRKKKAEAKDADRINDTLRHPKLYAPGPYRGAFDPVPGPAYITLGGDPRGPCGRLHLLPDLPGDGFGDGYAIW